MFDSDRKTFKDEKKILKLMKSSWNRKRKFFRDIFNLLSKFVKVLKVSNREVVENKRNNVICGKSNQNFLICFDSSAKLKFWQKKLNVWRKKVNRSKQNSSKFLTPWDSSDNCRKIQFFQTRLSPCFYQEIFFLLEVF